MRGDCQPRVAGDPGVTRLLDRMEKGNVMSRAPKSRDWRLVMARITPGVKLVNRLDEPVQDPTEAVGTQREKTGSEALAGLASARSAQ